MPRVRAATGAERQVVAARNAERSSNLAAISSSLLSSRWSQIYDVQLARKPSRSNDVGSRATVVTWVSFYLFWLSRINLITTATQKQSSIFISLAVADLLKKMIHVLNAIGKIFKFQLNTKKSLLGFK